MTYEKDGYKLVNHIDLNDTGLTIHARDWNDGAVLVDEGERQRAHLIFGSDIRKLLEVLGIGHGRYLGSWQGEERWLGINSLELCIHEMPPEFDNASNTKEIWAKVIGAHLLEIVIVYSLEDESGTLGDYPEEITYSGSFTVYWAKK